MSTRRAFLRDASLVALAPTVPGFLARAAGAGAGADPDGRILVVLQLDGGNDGINTVVPYRDEGYARHRQVLRLPDRQLLKITPEAALHPEMRDAARLLEAGRLAIVPGVGDPSPSRSHFRGREVWQSARLDPRDRDGTGWIGRALDGGPPTRGGAPGSISMGTDAPPAALRGRRSTCAALDRLDDYARVGEPPAPADPADDDLGAYLRQSALDAHATADRLDAVARARDAGATYPDSPLAARLRLTARLIKAGLGTRAYYLTHDGYDTHGIQLPVHGRLLAELFGALRAFLDDLAAAGLADRVLVLAFSEFGRRVAENGTAGTDHGTAGPVFLAGPGVVPGLLGPLPSLTDLVDGDLRTAVDFRRVYATLLQGWLGLPAGPALGGTFEPMPLLKV